MPKVVLKRKDLIYPELSYTIIGVLFNVWNVLSSGHKERFYQRAVAQALRESSISFAEQSPVKVYFKGKFIGVYYFDFFIEGKIVLEIKVREYFSKQDINQLYGYLKAKNLKLGIIAHITKSGIKFKRVVNL